MFIHEIGNRDNPTIILMAPMMVSGEELYSLMSPHLTGEYPPSYRSKLIATSVVQRIVFCCRLYALIGADSGTGEKDPCTVISWDA